MPDMIVWGATDLDTPADTRYLPLGYGLVTAPTTEIGLRVDGEITCLKMRAHHNTPTAEAINVTYTLYKNGVATGLSVVLAANASDGSELTADVDCAPGDLLTMRATKAAVLASGAVGALVTVGVV